MTTVDEQTVQALADLLNEEPHDGVAVSKPTRAQRAVLERMVAGHALRVGQYGRVYIQSQAGRLTDTVPWATVTVLVRERWVEFREDDGRYYALTAAGRQAVQQLESGS